jgi:hypothetical protein
MRFALAVCLLALTAPACNAPWQAETLPPGAAWVSYTELAPGPVGCGYRQAVVAGTSIEDLRQEVIATCTRPSACIDSPNACWQNLVDQPGYVYVAVLVFPPCNSPTRDNIAASATAIYFVHWIGENRGACNLMLALPPYRLFLVSRSGLHAGAVKVELQVQTEGAGTDTVDTEVTLA